MALYHSLQDEPETWLCRGDVENRPEGFDPVLPRYRGGLCILPLTTDSGNADGREKAPVIHRRRLFSTTEGQFSTICGARRGAVR